MHSSNQLANAVRQLVRQAIADLALPRIYLISSYDGKGAVKVNVSFDPGTPPVESNWMPLGGIAVGNGWGVMAGPQIGDQVMVIFENGDFESGVVVARIFSTVAQPMAVPSGELWNTHQKGAFFKLTNDGKASFSDGHGATVTLNGDGTITSAASQWHHAGPLAVAGDVSVTGQVSATTQVTAPTIVGSIDVTIAGKSLKTHVHSGVQAGANNTGAPV